MYLELIWNSFFSYSGMNWRRHHWSVKCTQISSKKRYCRISLELITYYFFFLNMNFKPIWNRLLTVGKYKIFSQIQLNSWFIFFLLSVWATWAQRVKPRLSIHLLIKDKWCQGSFQLLRFYNTRLLPRGWDLPWAIFIWVLIFDEEDRVKRSSNVTVNGRLAKMINLYCQFTCILWGTNFYPVHLDK